MAALRRGVERGRPVGDADGSASTAERLDLAITLRRRGRPKLKP